MKKHTIKDVRNLIEGKYELVDKALGVELVDTGFFNYKKLTHKNYYYWYYETENPKDAKPNIYTYDWSDLVKTRKFELLQKLIQCYSDSESAYRIMNDILQLDFAKKNVFDTETGVSEWDAIFEVLFSNRIHIMKRKKAPQQGEFLF